MEKFKPILIISLLLIFSFIASYEDTSISGEQVRNTEQFNEDITGTFSDNINEELEEEEKEYVDFIRSVNKEYESLCDAPPNRGVLLLSFKLSEDRTYAEFTGQKIYENAMLSCKPLFFDEENIVYAKAKEHNEIFYETRTTYGGSVVIENVKIPEGTVKKVKEPLILVKLPLTESVNNKIKEGFSLELLDESKSKLFEGIIPEISAESERSKSNNQLTGMASRGSNCVTTYKGGKNSKAMDILIMSQDFNSVQDLDDVAQTITNFITTTNPFNKVTSKRDYTKKYNIRYVNTLYGKEDLLCEDKSCLCGTEYRYGIEISLVGENAMNSGCPYDEILVVVEKPSGYCNNGNSIVWGIATEDYGVSYNSQSEWKYLPNLGVVYHEFGHSAFRLADEYTYYPPQIPWTSINCRDSCSQFSNPQDCKKGCSDHQHFRPSERSIMNSVYYTDPQPYNKPSRKRIRKVLRSY